MEKIKRIIKSNAILKNIYDELFEIKIWLRNRKAKPVREEQTKQANKLLDSIPAEGKKIYFCGVPTHKNLGDQAQRYCIRKWCKENYPDYIIVELPTWPFYDKLFQKRILSSVKPEDIIVIQSGYCTTDRHYDHPMHRFLVSNFQDNLILIMPQTVNFALARHARKTAECYNKHKHLLFLARDSVSYESAKKYFYNTDVELYPDIVTTLIGTGMYHKHKRNGVLLCIRNDSEKLYSDDDINNLKNKFDSLGIHCDIKDTNSSLPLNEMVENFEQVISDKIDEFATYEVVITDRYHGTIFSMIADTPVVVLSTLDHKVSTGTQWFKGIYNDSFVNADSVVNAFELSLAYINEKKTVGNSPYFNQEYYAELKDLVEQKR